MTVMMAIRASCPASGRSAGAFGSSYPGCGGSRNVVPFRTERRKARSQPAAESSKSVGSDSADDMVTSFGSILTMTFALVGTVIKHYARIVGGQYHTALVSSDFELAGHISYRA